MKRNITRILLGAAILTSCHKGSTSVTTTLDGSPPEFYTTVQLRLVNTGDPTDTPTAVSTQMSPFTHTYQADSLYSGQALLRLRTGSTYAGQVVVLDETQTPVDTVNKLIEARADYHLFFFQPSPANQEDVLIGSASADIPLPDWRTNIADTTAGGVSDDELLSGAPLNLAVTRTDLDSNRLQVGLSDTYVTEGAGTGILRVVLRIQKGQKDGAYAPGFSDLDVTFAVQIH